jgi:hypothetical protein
MKTEMTPSTPSTIYPTMNALPFDQTHNYPLWGNWNNELNGYVTVVMPFPEFYPGNTFPSYFPTYQP